MQGKDAEHWLKAQRKHWRICTGLRTLTEDTFTVANEYSCNKNYNLLLTAYPPIVFIIFVYPVRKRQNHL